MKEETNSMLPESDGSNSDDSVPLPFKAHVIDMSDHKMRII